ncbi:MAG: redoxin domain-containing protein [Rhodospirillales bacterium]|nr:redoxin domain-containing protein [Rhodospirillales bacterium]
MNAPQKPPMVYNNAHFTVKHYDWDVFAGPSAGEPYVDAALTDLETGEPVRLSDFSGKWVVIETGSSTCSMYTKNIPDMKAIQNDHPDVVFLLIYVREAHPGERLGPHQDFDEKVEAARLVKPRYNEHRRVLVDDVEGSFHKQYGMMPNILYVIRPDGTIHYRCNWATADDLRTALEQRDQLHTYENADVKKLKAARGLYTTVRTMWTGGFVALYDFVKASPGMAQRHLKVDKFYRENGAFNKKPGLFSEGSEAIAEFEASMETHGGHGKAAQPAQAQQQARQPGE